MLIQRASFVSWKDAVLNSYSQIFFSLNNYFAGIILFITFIDLKLGICGLSAVVLVNGLAMAAGLNRELIREGMYGFNALLLGMALGYEYQFSVAFVLFFVVAMLLLLLVTAALGSLLGKYKLPYLSFPFLLTYWLVYLAAGNFSNLAYNETYIYTANYAAKAAESPVFRLATSLNGIELPAFLLVYFKTLSATFFQNSVLAGMLLAAGLLFFSRIAFTLSLLGFASAYLFYNLFGADTAGLNYYLVGSNFIFIAIGIGCFYIVPDFWSYLAVVCLAPLVLMVLIGSGKVLGVWQLKAYTLPFSLVTILFLFFLHQRWFHRFLRLVTIQYYSAEKTIYKYLVTQKRFAQAHLAKVALPFWGEWKVSQGHEGKITHLGDWSKALDFVITDETGKTYKDPGASLNDFYCYDKPVTAPLDGYVYDIINNVDENEVGDVNTKQNWGNTIILNHRNGLFSQISHVKKDSFKVVIGEYVTRGTLLATCGNSGRSPEPHIHFQLQAVPTLGAKTLAYPLAWYIERKNNSRTLRTFEVPAEDAVISNVETSELLKNSFGLLPGMKLKFQNEADANDECTWEVFTDAWNRTYIWCAKTRSTAWFINDGALFYCYDFEGDKKSLLFSFYLAAYRVLLGYYNDIQLDDTVPLIHFNHPLVRWVQDFVAPFYCFTRAEYHSSFTYCDNELAPEKLTLQADVNAFFLKRNINRRSFTVELAENKIQKITIQQKNNLKSFVCVA